MDSTVITSDSIKSKIYTIRGVQVMLDSDLAGIYGYETKLFNEQVKNNIDKFPDDFMFQLTEEEVSVLSRSIIPTSIMQVKGIKGGRVYLPLIKIQCMNGLFLNNGVDLRLHECRQRRRT